MRDISAQLRRRLERLETARDRKGGMTDAALLRVVNANIEAGNVLRRTLLPERADNDQPGVDGAWVASLTPPQRRELIESIEDRRRASVLLWEELDHEPEWQELNNVVH